MDLQSLSLPDWMPWWAVVALLVPVSLYLALFLLMPFSTFGLRARLRDMELRIDALHEEVRGMTLRLPMRGMDPYDDVAPMDRPTMDRPPIPPAPRPPAPRETAPKPGFGDPVADRMLAYMRDKAQEELQRAEQPRVVRPRAEPRLTPRSPAPQPMAREPDLPPPPAIPEPAPDPNYPPDYVPEEGPPPGPPRLAGRFGRRPLDPDSRRDDWPR